MFGFAGAYPSYPSGLKVRETLDRLLNKPRKHVFGHWEEAGENPGIFWGKVQAPRS